MYVYTIPRMRYMHKLNGITHAEWGESDVSSCTDCKLDNGPKGDPNWNKNTDPECDNSVFIVFRNIQQRVYPTLL